MSRIRPVTARPAPSDKYPVYTSHRSRFVSLAVIFGSNGNPFTVTLESVMRIYTHILRNIEMLVGQKNKNIWDSGECRVRR